MPKITKILLAGVVVSAALGTASAQEGPPRPLGWVYSKYVDCPDGHPGHGCFIVRVDAANVRQYPNGPILLSLGRGTRVAPWEYADHDRWVLVAVREGEEPLGFFRKEEQIPPVSPGSPEDLPVVK
jgi:hypothetical protein